MVQIITRNQTTHATCSGGLFLGRSFGALDNEKPPEFLDDMDDFFAVTALRWFAPWMLTVLSLLPIPKIQHFLGAQTRSYEYGRTAFSEYIEQYGRHSGRIDLLTKMVGTEDTRPLTDNQISDELGSLLAGATDTTVVVATWLMWELAQRPDWQSKIRQELRDNRIDFSQGGVPQYKDIKKLPILNGFVMESMRLHPAQSIGLPRVAGTNDVSVGGVKLPAGVSSLLASSPPQNTSRPKPLPQTFVSLQSRNVQRDPEIYPSPNDFIPNRWIETNGGTQDMKDSFIIFSKGSRACLGSYVAMMELKFFVSSFVNGWSMKLGPETTRESMRQTDYFLAFPRDRELFVVFEAVEG